MSAAALGDSSAAQGLCAVCWFGIIIRARGAYTGYIISLITVRRCNYNAAGTRSTLRTFLVRNLHAAFVVNHRQKSQKLQKKIFSFFPKSIF